MLVKSLDKVGSFDKIACRLFDIVAFGLKELLFPDHVPLSTRFQALCIYFEVSLPFANFEKALASAVAFP
jgi:hypothetical protein